MASTTTVDTYVPQRSLIFRIAGHTYACDLSSLCEVLPLGQTTRIPHAPMWVIGLTNVRGTIVTLIDGGIWLHGSPCDRRRGSVILVDMGARPVGVLVDEIADIRAALRDETLYEPLDLRAALASVVAVSEDE